MKFLIASLALIAVASAQQYRPDKQNPVPIAILRQAQDISPEGSYNFAYETENGIAASESGVPGPVNSEGQAALTAQGEFSYTSDDGTVYNVKYVADENGFHPEGAHLPVAPPIPEEIRRSIEYNAAHPEEDESQPQQFNKRQF